MAADKDLRIAALEALVERLQHRNDELEAMILGAYRPPAEWSLPRREAQVFSMLVARGRATKEQLYTAIYSADLEETPVEIVESHVSKLRKRLRPFGVQITSKRYEGYTLVDPWKYRPAEGSS